MYFSVPVLDVDELDLNAGSKQKVKAFGALLKELVIKGTEMSADELIRDAGDFLAAVAGFLRQQGCAL